jgi:chromosome partitioning protein
MHTLGIANQKGGVGKTTTAINLAAGLALSGRRTLLVDMDPQGNGTSGIGVSRDAIDGTVYEAMMSLAPVEAAVYASPVEHLSVMPSDLRLIAAEREFMDQANREARLSRVLAPLDGRFDYVVVDAPPSLGLLTINVLCAVRHLIIPVQSEYYALEGLSMLMETTERVRATVNPDLEILGLLMTMVDGRTNLARQVVEEVIRHFGHKVFRTVIARSVRLSEAPSHGKPIMVYDPRSHAAQAHLALTEEVIHRCEGVSSNNTQHDHQVAAPDPTCQEILHDWNEL